MQLVHHNLLDVYKRQGHFHKPVAKLIDGIVIFNPSSISLPKAGVKSYGVYENDELKIFSLEKELIESIKL